MLKFNFFYLLLIFSVSSNFLYAIEQITPQRLLNNSCILKEFSPPNIPFPLVKVNKEATQSVNFVILDSIANAFSYFTESQQPFVFIPEINQLITIKRGYWDVERYPDYIGDDTKDNLFILYSTNWGKTWSKPILVYKVATSGSYWNWYARYPSVYAFDYDNEVAYVFTAPVTNRSGWVGFINGLYYQENSFINYSRVFTWKDGNRYNWGGTDSRIVAGMDGGEPYAQAVGTIMITGGLPLTLTSHLGFRRTTDFDIWKEEIPPQWEASKFKTPVSQTGEDSLRTSAIAGFKYAIDGNLYMAAYANFAESPLNRFYFGVSKSTDKGKTWSDFDIAPPDLLNSYLANYGLDISVVTWQLPQFVPLGNNNYSFVTNLNEDTTRTLRPYSDALHQLVEIYKENGVWGVRKVADLSGFILAYVGVNNQMGEETQLSITVDGTTLVCKWVDFVDVQTPDTIYRRLTNDIFASYRRLGSSLWSVPKNITESLDFDRITWIPDKVPSELNNIPILKLQSIPLPGQSDAEARIRQRTLDTVPQYLMLGFFNLDGGTPAPVIGDSNPEILIESVYPNPIFDRGFVHFSSSGNNFLTIELIDIFGRKIETIFSGNVGIGLQGITFSTENIPSGNYLVVATSNGKIFAKPITILK
ncbi:MAG: T9SS type A sorting domain-containing protein [Ignavibacteria bacterium]|nr:T9SS type A sorting domain-containing protein [Ignavibacteria bacterium]